MATAAPFFKDLSGRSAPLRFLEATVLAAGVAVAIASYFVITAGKSTQTLISPPIVALLLIANLLPGMALLVLIGRRIAIRRTARLPIAEQGGLHARLVALFSVIAAVPTLLLVIFASLLFQYGVQFWYSDQARSMIENATGVARTSYEQMLKHWSDVAVTAAADISDNLQAKLKSPDFSNFFVTQLYLRSLSDGFLFVWSPENVPQPIIQVNPDGMNMKAEISSGDIARLREGAPSVTTVKNDRIKTLTPVPGTTNVYLLTVAISDVKVMEVQSRRSVAVLASYRDLLRRSRSLQLRFNAVLLAVSLLIVALAVWIALLVADRLVRPIGELVVAAHRVATGDLTARVPAPRAADEVGALGVAFNQMTTRLEEQTGALESRRALIEAVMSGVSAGVISVAGDGTILLINRSAVTLLEMGKNNPVGRPLAMIAPELSALIEGREREAIVELNAGGDVKTLAVKLTRANGNPILTFDDITGQLLDQRRAAWADVARRIAHEIKNPLTPIQLAAERLQRRYGKQLQNDDGTFARLTETIVRQVADLRRMVDEFSSFARMPKPVFREETLSDIARQALFLHEVAHPAIRFTLETDHPPPILVCDRRQIGQALTNIVKNAVEAIEGRPGHDLRVGEIEMALVSAPGKVTITVADNGVGLPAARERLFEPYVTTRARGTGLGLAIVKKIVEEHFGTMTFADRDGGGTVLSMTFDTGQLAAVDRVEPADNEDAVLTTNLNRT